MYFSIRRPKDWVEIGRTLVGRSGSGNLVLLSHWLMVRALSRSQILPFMQKNRLKVGEKFQSELPNIQVFAFKSPTLALFRVWFNDKIKWLRQMSDFDVIIENILWRQKQYSAHIGLHSCATEFPGLLCWKKP